METVQKTTLCYIEKDEKYLMLFRNKKKSDLNKGKWIGVGGKMEEGENAHQGVLREIKEETGLVPKDVRYVGEIYFYQGDFSEVMYLFKAYDVEETLETGVNFPCPEGELRWINKSDVLNLALWEGDKIFLRKLLAGESHFNLSLYYEGDTLVKWEEM